MRFGLICCGLVLVLVDGCDHDHAPGTFDLSMSVERCSETETSYAIADELVEGVLFRSGLFVGRISDISRESRHDVGRFCLGAPPLELAEPSVWVHRQWLESAARFEVRWGGIQHEWERRETWFLQVSRTGLLRCLTGDEQYFVTHVDSNSFVDAQRSRARLTGRPIGGLRRRVEVRDGEEWNVVDWDGALDRDLRLPARCSVE